MSVYEHICFSIEGEIPRVQIEELCEGCILLCEAENISKSYWKKGILVVLYMQDIAVMHYSLGLGESSLDHRRREEFPAIFTMVVSFGGVMKELSVFIDESGDGIG